MTAKLDLIALGVSDIERARQFYEHGFGCRVEADGAEFVKVRLARRHPRSRCAHGTRSPVMPG